MKHAGKYRVIIPAKRFGAPRPRYFTSETDARAQAQAIFAATRIVVAIERMP
jgi:hypothetical protein